MDRQLTIDTGRLRRGVDQANIPTLVALLAHLNDDARWSEKRYRPSPPVGLDDNDSGGLPGAIQQEIREAAYAAIVQYLQSDSLPERTPAEFADALSRAMGEVVPVEYGPMIASDLSTVIGQSPPADPVPSAGKAIIIGAGLTGLCAAVYLQKAGIDFTILERNEAVGGSWLENTYPGAGVDTPSHLYEFSFAPHDWPRYFSTRDDVKIYLNHVADRFAIIQHIRVRTEVLAARFDEEQRRWNVEVRTEAGIETLHADFVISAVGAFSRPKIPNIVGVERFQGDILHTARWGNVDVKARNVAVVGNGASAMQVVTSIVDQVEHLTIFQRSPHWIAPFDRLRRPVPEGVRYLLNEVPLYHGWYRLRLGWTFNDKLHSSLQRDPDWKYPKRSINAVNDGHRRFFTRYLREQLDGRPDLIDKLLPTYPPYGKRILLDHGWFASLRKPNVELVNDGIVEVHEDHLVTADGRLHSCDVLVFATGFDVVRFLGTYDVIGRGGRSLRQVWDDDNARAYLGTAVPGFPNFFILYGPNTQPGHGGSLISAVEAQVQCVVKLLSAAARRGLASVEIRQDVFDEYNARVDAAHDEMVWTHPGMDTYYRNARGRVVVNNPYRIVDFWQMTQDVSIADFDVDEMAKT